MDKWMNDMEFLFCVFIILKVIDLPVPREIAEKAVSGPLLSTAQVASHVVRIIEDDNLNGMAIKLENDGNFTDHQIACMPIESA